MRLSDILASTQDVISWTYDSRLTVYGKVAYTKPNGADGYRDAIIDHDIPCRISRDKRVSIDFQEVAKNQNTHILFTTPHVTIPPGSKLEVDGKTYQLTDEPMVYPSHQEVRVRRDEWV